MILFLCFIIAIFILGICLLFYSKKKEKRNEEIAQSKINAKNSMLKKLKENNFEVNKDVFYNNIGICVDDINKQWCLYNLTKGELTIYDYTGLLSFKVECERLREKDEYSNNTPNKYFINAYINIDDIDTPTIKFCLGRGEGRPSTAQREKASEFEGVLTFIKENSKKQTRRKNNND